MNRFFFFVAFLIFSTGLSWAEERASESDMFGGGSSATPTPTVKEETAKADKGESAENLQIGGTLSSEGDFYIQNNTPFFQNTVSNPNILFLYVDSKLENDARVFLRTRTFYDPTGISGGNPTFSSLTNPYGFGNGTNDNLSTTLQELRLSANANHRIFFTIGRQKVKYGTAHFFNPTDFLNAQPFNFFLPTDERPGVDMIKVQVPSGTANLYAAGVFGNPTSGNQSGGYFRGEVAYDNLAHFLDNGEISLSGWFPKDQAGRAGFDISQAVGDLDVYFEGAAGQDSSGNWKDAVSTGFSWETKYADRNTNTLSLSGEYFQAGALVEMGVFAIALGGPWGLNDVTFVESNLFDFNGQSGLSRLDIDCQLTERISGRVYGSTSWGATAGAFYFFNQAGQLGTRLDVNF